MSEPLTRFLHEQAEQSRDKDRLEVVMGGPAVFARMLPFAAAARSEALSLEPLQVHLPAIETRAANALDRQLLRRGVRQMNVISDPLDARTDAHIIKDLARAGSPTRHSSAVPLRVQIYDRRVAFFALDAADTRRGAYVTTAPTLVQIACRLFDEIWQRAQVVPGLGGPDSIDGTIEAKQLHVLNLLADGYTDERIAHRMGVSTRTVVRVVAQLQNDLGAKSRFQLALAAQRSGLLSAHPAEPAAGTVTRLPTPPTP